MPDSLADGRIPAAHAPYRVAALCCVLASNCKQASPEMLNILSRPFGGAALCDGSSANGGPPMDSLIEAIEVIEVVEPRIGAPVRDPEMHHIHRASDKLCWHVGIKRRPNEYAKRFFDSTHGGRDESLAAANAWRDQMLAEHPLIKLVKKS
jgi:hypothetical protein